MPQVSGKSDAHFFVWQRYSIVPGFYVFLRGKSVFLSFNFGSVINEFYS